MTSKKSSFVLSLSPESLEFYSPKILEEAKPVGISDFSVVMQKLSRFETGFMWTQGNGLVSIRNMAGRSQVVYQLEPQTSVTYFTNYERDKVKRTHTLGYPYRILIIDYHNGTLLGARQFFSPVPIEDFDQPLYYPSLPNINCFYYNNTSIGWVCLYHSKQKYTKNTDSKGPITPAQMILLDVDRATGAESYNENMCNIDGRWAYKTKSMNDKQKILADEYEWAELTKKHGIEWTQDPDFFIPIYINWEKQPSQQQSTYSKSEMTKANLLTFGDAVYKPYSPYYNTDPNMNPFNWDFSNLTEKQKEFWLQWFITRVES